MSYYPDTQMTLTEGVQELNAMLHGIDITLVPELSDFYTYTRHINRALRSIALEVEWSYYSDVISAGRTRVGQKQFAIPRGARPRITSDDSVRLVDRHGDALVWAYFLPRDALSKYARREGLWVAVTGTEISFSRAISRSEAGLEIQIPVMRAPRMFELPPRPRAANAPLPEVPEDVLEQPIDFELPDLVILKAAVYAAESHPVLQPRVQQLDDRYKDMMYNLKERDESFTDMPYMNDFPMPMQSDIYGQGSVRSHGHPHADERRR